MVIFSPAAGVIATRPVIMPWTAPITEGFLKKMMSSVVQVSKLTAVARLVFKTAAPASGEAAYGSPPLKPFHPSQRIPAPTSDSRMLWGLKFSRSCLRRGPTHQAATNPAVPEET